MLTTWRDTKDGKVMFEIAGTIPKKDGKTGELEQFKTGYVAIGFSEDQVMVCHKVFLLLVT